jgi:threonine/homoserine/homoserine lactone efflux protein
LTCLNGEVIFLPLLNISYLQKVDLLIKGIFLGLTLSILVGPIIFALLQTAIERGFRAGAMVGFGVWVSDIMYILLAYFGVSYIVTITEYDGFEEILGTVGGLVLIGFGLSTLFTKPPPIPNEYKPAEDIIDEQLPKALDFDDDDGISRPGYLSLWLKGFLINTLNPFTIFFWTGVTGSMVAGQNFTHQDALIFFGGIFATVMLTDILKIWAAKAVRHLLKPNAILILRRVSGVALALFGVVLMVRVLWF